MMPDGTTRTMTDAEAKVIQLAMIGLMETEEQKGKKSIGTNTFEIER